MEGREWFWRGKGSTLGVWDLGVADTKHVEEVLNVVKSVGLELACISALPSITLLSKECSNYHTIALIVSTNSSKS